MTLQTKNSDMNPTGLNKLCQTFPPIGPNQIQRDGIIALVKKTLESNIDVVTLEGQEGMGKTTALAQFALSSPHDTLSMFVRPVSKYAYDPELLLFDLCNQMNFAVSGSELDPDQVIDDGFVRRLVTKLQKVGRIQHRIFYFVVDGLDDIPPESGIIRDQITDLLPIGFSHFKFIISGGVGRLKRGRSSQITHQSVLIPFFSLSETFDYFSDSSIPKSLVEELWHGYNGFPAVLASARRLLESGVSPEKVLLEVQRKTGDLFDLEWAAVDMRDETLVGIVALITHTPVKQTLADLAVILSLPLEEIRDSLAALRFVYVPPENEDIVDFVSDAFRKFAVNKLQEYREFVHNKLIDALTTAGSDKALFVLPTYLEKAGRLPDLVEYLSPDHFAKMLERSRSLTLVQQQVDLGLETATKLDRIGEMLRFGVQKSLISDFEGYKALLSEVEARLALGRYDAAVAQAENVVLKEDRLRLLAAIARFKRQQGLTPEPEFIEQIERLLHEIDPLRLGEAAKDLASDLLFVKPELAIELVEHAPQINEGAEGVERTLFELSLLAASDRQETRGEYRQRALETIRSKIKDPGIIRFSTSFAILVSDYSAEQMIAEVKRIDEPEDKLFLLRGWAKNTRNYEGAADLVDFALTLTISTTAFTPNASHFCDLITPPPVHFGRK
jgi:hypothetical protein